MKCMICDTTCAYYFSKTYSEPPFDTLMREVGAVEYHKCPRCGFVASATHCELPAAQWDTLNRSFHSYLEDNANERFCNQPPYAEQAMMLSMLGRSDVIRTDSIVDYAAGHGTLSRIMEKHFDTKVPIYDPYVQAGDPDRYILKSALKTYKTVINSAMFEHVLEREDLEQVNRLVEDDGCLVLHTVICERVPDDPNWFYLRPPVHTAFHTNESMRLLMGQWGYHSSIYSPKSKCWVLLKADIATVERKIAALNDELQCTWFHYQSGFMDYWKGF